jgi:hypothetical protein
MNDSLDGYPAAHRDGSGDWFRRRFRRRFCRRFCERRTGGSEPLPRTPSAASCGGRSGHGLCLPDGWLFGLLVPADPEQACALIMLRDSAAHLSDALGGALLDEAAVDGRPTHRCWLYLDVTRHTRRLPRNRRLERLAAELGWSRDRSGSWLGPALITGRDLYWADRDVPSIVVAAALRG